PATVIGIANTSFLCIVAARYRKQQPAPQSVSLPLAGLADPRNLAQPLKKRPLPRAIDPPINRRTLIAVLEPFAFHAIIEVAPRHIFLDGRKQVVARLVEVEMIVFVI